MDFNKDQLTEKINTMAEAFIEYDMISLSAKADESIEYALKYRHNPDHSLILHAAYTYLGLASLDLGDLETARKHLIASINVPNNKAIKSFGPNMLLARELLSLGHFDIVLQYLELAKSKWLWPLRLWFSRGWKNKIKEGIIPNFHFLLIANLIIVDKDKKNVERFKQRIRL